MDTTQEHPDYTPFWVTLTIDGTQYENHAVEISNPEKTIWEFINAIIEKFELPKRDEQGYPIIYQLAKMEGQEWHISEAENEHCRIGDWVKPNDQLGLVTIETQRVQDYSCESDYGLAGEESMAEEEPGRTKYVREVKTFDHDDQEFIWEFPQQAAGRYCVRIMQLTEEGGYIVIAQGEPLDDDIEFDYENARLNNSGKEGISLTVYYDEGPGPEVDPGEATAVPPTAAPTAAPTEAPTEAPTAAPTEAPAEPTEQAGEATEKPADDNKGNTEKDKKDNTWLIVGIVAAVVVVAAVACIAAIAAKKKKK